MSPTRADAVGIRPARTDDQDEVDRLYAICLRTGDSGSDATDQYTDPRLLGEIYLGPYLRFEPDLAFVAVDADDRPVGYVVGTRDTKAFRRELEAAWWPPLRTRYPRGAFPQGTPDAQLVELIHAPDRTPDDIVDSSPAHLHVDLLPEAQGLGAGRRLLETLFAALRDAGVGALHLVVSPHNTRGRAFYLHLGFVPLTADGNALGITLS